MDIFILQKCLRSEKLHILASIHEHTRSATSCIDKVTCYILYLITLVTHH
jgi:hypothetical protein